VIALRVDEGPLDVLCLGAQPDGEVERFHQTRRRRLDRMSPAIILKSGARFAAAVNRNLVMD
jgi:hypothetical protein